MEGGLRRGSRSTQKVFPVSLHTVAHGAPEDWVLEGAAADELVASITTTIAGAIAIAVAVVQVQQPERGLTGGGPLDGLDGERGARQEETEQWDLAVCARVEVRECPLQLTHDAGTELLLVVLALGHAVVRCQASIVELPGSHQVDPVVVGSPDPPQRHPQVASQEPKTRLFVQRPRRNPRDLCHPAARHSHREIVRPSP